MEDYAFTSEIGIQVNGDSSSAWLSELNRLKDLKKRITSRIKEWDAYINKLQGLSGGGRVAVIKNGLENANSSLNGGGYVSGGVGLCNKEIKAQLKKMNGLGEKIDSVIDDSISAYDKITKSDKTCNENIKYAEQQYRAALQREAEEAARQYSQQVASGQGVHNNDPIINQWQSAANQKYDAAKKTWKY